MHCSNFEIEGNRAADGGEILVTIAALVTEGRIVLKSPAKTPGFYEGPHCNNSSKHDCDSSNTLCSKFEKVRAEVLELWQKKMPLCVEVVLTAGCSCEMNADQFCSSSESDSTESGFLLEQWLIGVNHRRIHDNSYIKIADLMNAIRSQLYFSQISAWLTVPEHLNKISKENIKCRISFPGETLQMSHFRSVAIKHDFPATDIGGGFVVQISLFSLPRLPQIPTVKCNKCESGLSMQFDNIKINSMPPKSTLIDDRMHTACTLKGKHRCEDYEDYDNWTPDNGNSLKFKRICSPSSSENYMCKPSTSKSGELPNVNYSTYYSKYGAKDVADETCLKFNEKTKVEPRIKKSKMMFNFSDSYSEQADSSDRVNTNDLNDGQQQSKGDILLNALIRSSHLKKKTDNESNVDDKIFSKPTTECGLKNNDCKQENKNVSCDSKCVQNFGNNVPILRENAMNGECNTNNSLCDKTRASGDNFSIKDKSNNNIYLEKKYCDSPIPKIKHKKVLDLKNLDDDQYIRKKFKARQKITFTDDLEDNRDKLRDTFLEDKLTALKRSETEKELYDVPSPTEQAQFRKSLDNATSMVFHSRTGLPLTSSPAPIRRGKSCFDFDSSINSVSAIGNALCSSIASDEESESDSSAISPCSPETCLLLLKELPPVKRYKRKPPHNLLGSFVESVLNGRLEPESTVHGFTAELGASGSFVPKHLAVPVTVFFYSLGDFEKVSSPFMGHINLGKRGYQVPKSGTVQVTLFNHLGSVVKMFVVMYDLNDMPPNTNTFIRQRTLFLPSDCHDETVEYEPKWLRYLIHLRFRSSKGGRIYLHSDIRMVIFRKFDLDTATAHVIDKSFELRSFTQLPSNPRYSHREKFSAVC